MDDNGIIHFSDEIFWFRVKEKELLGLSNHYLDNLNNLRFTDIKNYGLLNEQSNDLSEYQVHDYEINIKIKKSDNTRNKYKYGKCYSCDFNYKLKLRINELIGPDETFCRYCHGILLWVTKRPLYE